MPLDMSIPGVFLKMLLPVLLLLVHGIPVSSALQISPNGQCGGEYTCIGSQYGTCCSPHGWCGNTPEHCGVRCNPAFGLCSGNLPSVPSSTSTGCPNPGTVLVTETVRQTFVHTVTSIVRSTSTSTSVIFHTYTTTETVKATSTPPPETSTVTFTTTIALPGISPPQTSRYGVPRTVR
ncbi:hypothetical protein VTJ49DRAFT_6408 [Mycothermus thermophilus]|uniref:Chitin-binding type-1 domain-containing protein n=1 Tax=Humicola insolens TaxID=85995 RepID=A0ABR3VQ14_HUMIN